ncbi:hypothetical protein BDR07DRAFT_1398829, partial [Suillus spraguei]
MADVLIAFLCRAFFLNTPQHLVLAAPLQPVSSTLRKHATTNSILSPLIGLLGNRSKHDLRLHDDLVLHCWYCRYWHRLSFHCL